MRSRHIRATACKARSHPQLMLRHDERQARPAKSDWGLEAERFRHPLTCLGLAHRRSPAIPVVNPWNWLGYSKALCISLIWCTFTVFDVIALLVPFASAVPLPCCMCQKSETELDTLRCISSRCFFAEAAILAAVSMHGSNWLV